MGMRRVNGRMDHVIERRFRSSAHVQHVIAAADAEAFGRKIARHFDDLLAAIGPLQEIRRRRSRIRTGRCSITSQSQSYPETCKKFAKKKNLILI